MEASAWFFPYRVEIKSAMLVVLWRLLTVISFLRKGVQNTNNSIGPRYIEKNSQPDTAAFPTEPKNVHDEQYTVSDKVNING
ncbi:MAG: hypothetical protein A6F71_07255 [Cycloclasticus sp. symbiont of Poecilosclerida sp. M]|nr:MAG: hypothetical protein A6F71_07255 [Cycloclasticus sp. symbiont of Poecilosclerida sp. M]